VAEQAAAAVIGADVVHAHGHAGLTATPALTMARSVAALATAMQDLPTLQPVRGINNQS
jgi:hypothetical protein